MKIFINKDLYEWGGYYVYLFVAKDETKPIEKSVTGNFLNVEYSLSFFETEKVIKLLGGKEVTNKMGIGLKEIPITPEITKAILRRKLLNAVSDTFSEVINEMPFEIRKGLERLTLVYDMMDLSISSSWIDGYEDGIM